MDNTREPAGHLSAIIAIGLLLIGLFSLEWSNKKPGAIKRNSPKDLKHAWRALPSNRL